MYKNLPGGGVFRLSQTRIKYTLSLVITIIGLLSLFVGTSYAVLKGIDTSNNEQVIKAGSVKLKLTEKFESIDKKITVMSDVDGLVQDTTYDFNLKNIGSEPAKFDMKLVNEVPSNYTGEVLSLDYFKVGLEINGEEHGPMSLEDVKGIIDSDVIYEKELINYKLRIWLDEEKSEELKTKEDYKAFLKLEVEAQQRVEEMDEGVESPILFSYTGDVQEYRVPRDGYYKIEAWGAEGGSSAAVSGKGGYTKGEIYLEAGEKLYFYVGGKGSTASANTTYISGGYNGGGQANASAGTGGGATDVRLEKGVWNDTSSLASRIMVAGAGGGAGIYNNLETGGSGGGIIGTDGGDLSSEFLGAGHGGTQISGGSLGSATGVDGSTSIVGTIGSFGTGGKAGYHISYTHGAGAGGAGYYGGAGGNGRNGGGAGGSSYISGHTGCVAVTSENDTTPKSGCTTGTTNNSCSVHYSNKKFINTVMIDGSGYVWSNKKVNLQRMPKPTEDMGYYQVARGNEGNGYARITYLESEKEKEFTYTGNVQEYKVPKDGYYYIEMAGAQGGTTPANYYGGYGAETSGYLYLKENEKLYFYVGGTGTSGTAGVVATFPGGYNGGGNGYVNRTTCSQSNASGGGATDLRLTKSKSDEKYRYVRNYMNGSDKNTGNHWVEIQVYDTSGKLISNGKTVTYNGTAYGNYTNPQVVTDGDVNYSNYLDITAGEDTYVEIDLGAEYNIGYIKMYHYYNDGRIYNNNKLVLFDNDKEKKLTIFDSDVDGTYAESSSGKIVHNVDKNSLISRIMVAGGGGGGYNEYCSTSDSGYVYGGHGGTLYGDAPIYQSYVGYSSLNPKGGTQTTGGQGLGDWTATSYINNYAGSFGVGGTGGNSYSGGGGGYYGGASGVWQPGAGGSSYISGYAGVDSVQKSNNKITHTGQTLHYSGKYFVGGKMLLGSNLGNGYAKIKYVGDKPKRKNTDLNKVRYIKDCTNYNSANSANHWVEIQVMKDGVNIAKGKPITGTTAQNASYPYSAAVDGSLISNGAGTYGTPNTAANNQCVTIDLEKEYDLDEIMVINSNIDQRSYYDATTYVSSDNSNWKKVINEAYIDSANGRRINAYVDIGNGYIQDNLVLWYDGYANNGGTRTHVNSTWKDLSGTGNNGSIATGTWYPDYFYMNGSSAYLTTAYNATLAPDEFTIDLTFSKLSIVSNTRSILFVKWTGYTIELNPDNTVVFGTRASTTDYPYLSGGVIELNKKYHVVATYKDNVEKIYINGELKNSRVNLASTFAHTATALTIGRYSSSYYSHVNLYQAKFYNKALSDDEIKHNYLHDKQKFKLD